MVHYTRIVEGMAQYLERDIAPHFAGGPGNWIAKGAAGLGRELAGNLFRAALNHPLMQIPGMVEGENINLELLYKVLLPIAREEPATIKVPVLGPVTLKGEDIEAIHRYIVGA